MLKDAEKGSWVLVKVFNKHPQIDKLQRDHAVQKRRLYRLLLDNHLFLPLIILHKIVNSSS
jgi:hypothetical protein